MSLAITVCHHSASLVMPNGDPRDRFFYPTLTLMIDSYSLIARQTNQHAAHFQYNVLNNLPVADLYPPVNHGDKKISYTF